MKIYTKFDRPENVKEENSGEIKVEKAGYIKPKIQIENMIEAGTRLNESRKEQFDFPPGEEIDESYFDKTRSPNYDLADATEDLRDLTEKAEDFKAEKKALSIDKAKRDREAEITKRTKAAIAEGKNTDPEGDEPEKPET